LEQPNVVAWYEHMNRWKSILSVLIALWLPLQGYTAVTMPFCQHRMAAASAHSGNADHSQHHHDGHSDRARGHAQGNTSQSSDADSPQPAAMGEASGLACNNCGACHLACAPAIVAIVSVPLLIAGSVLESALADSLQLFYPEQPQRPPLPTLL
jgi:ferredoxin